MNWASFTLGFTACTVSNFMVGFIQGLWRSRYRTYASPEGWKITVQHATPAQEAALREAVEGHR